MHSREIVEHKARQAYDVVKGPVLVEDVSLRFTALNDLPGPFIKYFEASIGLNGMCRMLDSFDDCSAVARVTYGLLDSDCVHFFEEEMTGQIVDFPRGDNDFAFGFDFIFANDGYNMTRAQMSRSRYYETSYRVPAI